ncbi:MAG: GspH/FimT family pseudopilin [Syntrophorhabdaceae bacterium]
MRNSKGFSLLELLIVIAIIMIVAAIGLPNYNNFVRKNRIHNQTKRIYSDLASMRTMAMNSNRTHFMQFGLPNNQYQVVEDTNGNNLLDPPPADTVRLVRTAVTPFTYANVAVANEAMTIQAGTFTNNLIRFDSRGVATEVQGSGAVCLPSGNLATQTNCVAVELTRQRIGHYDHINEACNAANCR